MLSKSVRRTRSWRRKPSRHRTERPVSIPREETSASTHFNDELASLPVPTQMCTSPPVPTQMCAQDDGHHRVIAVGSGKGGVGKTVVSSSLALALADSPLGPVTAIDVDLGGANLHAGLGIPRPTFALNQFLLDGAALEKLSEPAGTDGLRFIGGASDIVGLAEFSDEHRERFLTELATFPGGTSILDLGAGSSLFNLDLFCLADHGVLVTTPEPTAIQNAYGFLRAAVYRRLRLLFDGESGLTEMIDKAMNHRGDDTTETIPSLIRHMARYNRTAAARVNEVIERGQIGLIVNMCGNGKAEQLAGQLAQVAQQYLGVRLDLLGSVARCESVQRAVCEWRPLITHYPQGTAARSLKSIANRILNRLEPRERQAASSRHEVSSGSWTR